MGLPGFGGGRYNHSKCLMGSQQPGEPLLSLDLGAASGSPLSKLLLGSGESLFRREDASTHSSPGSWARGPSCREQQPKPHILVLTDEKCWELRVAGVCDMSHCSLGVKLLDPLPLRGWCFPWVSYLFSVCNAAKGKRWGLLSPCAGAVVEYPDLYKHAQRGEKSVVCFPV